MKELIELVDNHILATVIIGIIVIEGLKSIFSGIVNIIYSIREKHYDNI